jgi:hypothetical protein
MSNITTIIVEKTGLVKEHVIKTFDENELYKKAGFKNAEGFKCHANWNIEDLSGKSYSIFVYGKTTGRANQENKYDFPPPIDITLFFGSCLIINKKNDVPTHLTLKEWENVYEYLFGGFEDIDEEDSDEDEEDLDDDRNIPLTKSGYAKDGFVIDDLEEEDEYDDLSEEEDDEEEDEKLIRCKNMRKNAKKQPKKGKNEKIISVAVTEDNDNDNDVLECTSELSSESYI